MMCWLWPGMMGNLRLDIVGGTLCSVAKYSESRQAELYDPRGGQRSVYCAYPDGYAL